MPSQAFFKKNNEPLEGSQYRKGSSPPFDPHPLAQILAFEPQAWPELCNHMHYYKKKHEP
jgi:hypothetical protein